jgi:hypothetical protein
VAVVSERTAQSTLLLRLAPRARVALVSGRAVLQDETTRLGAEAGFALSCHADAKALRRLARDTGAGYVYLGPRHSAAFEATLRRAGLGVTRFERRDLDQLELFP